jgi:CshA-type fibril repeat protein
MHRFAAGPAHPGRTPASSRPLGLRLWALALTACLMLLGLFTAGPAFAGGPALSLTSGISVGGATAQSTATVASGASNLQWLVNYTCSNQPCIGAVATLTLPHGVSVGSPSYDPTAISAVSQSGSTMTFAFNDLPAGATGQIGLPISIPAWVTPNGVTFAMDATITSNNAGRVDAPTVNVTIGAGNTTSGDAAQKAGGALESTTTYALSTCIFGSSDPTFGPLSVEAGSSLVVVLPAGASFGSASGGGVYAPAGLGAPATVTWSYAAQIGGYPGCYPQTLVLRYLSSNGNLVGQHKTLDATWTGHSIGESQDRTLGTASYTTTLIPPTAGATVNKTAPGTQLATTTAIGFAYNATNTGTATWDSTTISDPIAPQFDPDAITVSDYSQGNGSFYISTVNGPDGIAGTSDDGQEFLVDSSLTPGARDSFNPSVSFPNGHAPLATGDHVTAFRAVFGAVDPGSGGDFVDVHAVLMPIDRNGQPVRGGDVVDSIATFTTPVGGAPLVQLSNYAITVAQQIPTVATRLSGPGTLPVSVRSGNFTLSGSASDFPLNNPVFVLVAPAGVTLDPSSLSTGGFTLPAPTETTVANWQGTGATLYRFTFPVGTVLPTNQSYSVTLTAHLAPTAYGDLVVDGYVSSATDPILLDSNYFVSGPNADNKDDSGDLTKILGKWSSDIQPSRSVSAALSQEVKGSWDSTFAVGPATGNTTPGSQDTYRLLMANTGTVEMNGAIAIDVLPRPGDTNVLSGTSRNAFTNTFPVVLDGRPVVPNLTTPVVTSYTTVAEPCRPELGYSPLGCNAPNWVDWSQTAPSDLTAVTALKFDFGDNLLKPGLLWTVDTPVTTPTSGVTPTDHAVSNPAVGSPGTDEVAYNSSAFVIKEAAVSSFLSPSEATKVGLGMPNARGIAGVPPVVQPRTSSGPGGTVQSVTLTLPLDGTAAMLDGSGNPVTQLTMPGAGVYDFDGTNVLSFHPLAGYAGTPVPVRFRVTNAFGDAASSTYTPTVTLPAPPVVTPESSTQSAGSAQTVTVPVPPGDSISLLNGAALPAVNVVTADGTYTLNPQTDVITFTARPGFTGTARPVNFRITDLYGQQSQGTYTAHVTLSVTPTPQPTPTPTPRAYLQAARLQVTDSRHSVAALCRIDSSTIRRCTVTAYASVFGRLIVIGSGATVPGSATQRGTVQIRLNARGQQLADTPGGVLMQLRSDVLTAATPTVLHSRTTSRFVNALVIPLSVFFDESRFGFTPAATAQIDALRGQLHFAPPKSVTCYGNTDIHGGIEQDYELGLTRAQDVCAYLTRWTNIQIKLVSFGKTRPITDNLTPLGLALNRRVDIFLNC